MRSQADINTTNLLDRRPSSAAYDSLAGLDTEFQTSRITKTSTPLDSALCAILKIPAYRYESSCNSLGDLVLLSLEEVIKHCSSALRSAFEGAEHVYMAVLFKDGR